MLRILREAEYVLYKVPYLSQVQQEKDKKETNSRGRRYVPTLRLERGMNSTATFGIYEEGST